jgi:DNA mismatch repair protein MutL
MENSIDAGAARIAVAVEDGGRKSITVTDDGCGMDEQDIAKAFEPHATSKIKTSEDLHRISTMGFRGEALASIASVAQVKIFSRMAFSNAGSSLEIDCGQKGPVTPCSCDYGTTICVRELFYKMPARRKFLKTANTEMGHITECFTRIALANLDIAMTLTSGSRELYNLPAKDDALSRISKLFPELSNRISENLLETKICEKGVEIVAFMGKPAISRTNNNMQYVFLNGRYIRDKFISHAIKEAYRPSIESDRFPVVFLFIRMPSEDYDVNVHPTKVEVRFFNSNLLHSQVLATLRQKLLSADMTVDAKLPADTEPFYGGTGGRANPKIAEAMAEFFKAHRPIQGQRHLGFDNARAYSPPAEKFSAPAATSAPSLGGGRFLQIHNCFIVTETDEGFIIIDQHALHERIIYEQMRKRLSAGSLVSQKLLIPESFEVTRAHTEIIKNHAEVFEKLGVEIIPFGPDTMAVQAFPLLLGKAEPLDFVRDLIDLLAEKGANFDEQRLLDEILNMAACKAAIKAGQKLTESEIEQLLAERDNTPTAGRCPHGRPTAIKFSTAELEKQFKRT